MTWQAVLDLPKEIVSWRTPYTIWLCAVQSPSRVALLGTSRQIREVSAVCGITAVGAHGSVLAAPADYLASESQNEIRFDEIVQ